MSDFNVWQSFDDLWAFGSADDHALAITAPKLRDTLAASEQRNRELQEDWQRKNEQVIRLVARLDAAEKLVRKCRDEMGGLPHSLGYAFTHLPEIDAWLAIPAQPAAGEAEVEDELDRLGKALTHPALRKVIWP